MLASMKSMAGVNITTSENGPYLVSGEVGLADGDGREVPHGEHMALCRCGHAKNKPFCDGMHVATCFDGTLKH
jgi:CDGSH iron-sulfur domain-containing protein 3